MVQQEMRKMLTAAAREVFPSLIKAQIDLAQGVYVEEIVVAADHTGKKTKAKRRVYQRPPSQEAVKYVMDQAIGKPKETKEVQGKSHVLYWKTRDDWTAKVTCWWDGKQPHATQYTVATTLADCMAKMLIYLLENKLL
jgi:hypothetical protein